MSLNDPVDNETLLEVRDLEKYFQVDEGIISSLLRAATGGEADHVHAVDGVTFDLKRGETLGLAGESGCGKTTTGMSLVKLHEATDGSIRFRGTDLTDAGEEEMAQFRQNAQMIFQDPSSR